MIKINPITNLDTEIKVSGSKYIANRVLLIAALADGTSIIRNVPENDDIKNTIKALEQFGVKIKKDDNTLTINGTSGNFTAPKKAIDVGHSGTLLRFMAGFASLAKGTTIITGSERIRQRPIKDLLDALQKQGIYTESKDDYPPVKLYGGKIKGGSIQVKASVSSQYISSLLLISSFAREDVEIIIKDELSSKNYVDLTIELMKRFGVDVESEDYKRFIIRKGQAYSAKEYVIPADPSSASYFMAAAAIVPGTIKINGFDKDSIQGESKFCDVLEKMGCRVRPEKNSITITGKKDLKGIDIDMNSMPDVVQTLASVAVFAVSKTTIKNIENLKYKECDRINDTAEELRKLGASVETKDDEIIITPRPMKGTVLDTHDDHRMAMSLSLIGLKIPDIIIKNPQDCKKSFPDFYDKLKDIGVKVEDV